MKFIYTLFRGWLCPRYRSKTDRALGWITEFGAADHVLLNFALCSGFDCA